MNNTTRNRFFIASALATCAIVQIACGPKAAEQAAAPPPATFAPCELPTTQTLAKWEALATTNPDEASWRLFVGANCATSGKLTWETWTEQTCLADPTKCPTGTAPRRTLHASRLAVKSKAAVAPPGTPGGVTCGSMTTSASTGVSSLLPFVPANLKPGAKFCEEVFANPPEADYIRTNHLQTLTGQQAFTQTIDFKKESLEVKVDWVAASTFTNVTCSPALSSQVYTETIDGTCYLMVGMHLSSKLLPNWLWSTFEPQYFNTNPNRCNPALYSDCRDSWGSNPAVSTGAATQPTDALNALFTQAGTQLAAGFRNYRLTGSQTDFVDKQNNPVALGNSFVEFNAQVLAGQASCITCHANAQLLKTGVVKGTNPPSPENPNFGPFPAVMTSDPTSSYPGTPNSGNAGTPPTAAQGGGTWVKQDFSWLLGILPVK